MDFETHYTPEQEREREEFRNDVCAWLKDNIEGVGAPPDASDLTYEQFQRNRAFLRKLGERGWYGPTWPKEYGGGGLSQHVAAVLREDFEAEYLFFLAITDPNAPRRQNLSIFLVPFGLPGITMTDHDMIAGSRKRTIIFQDVRAPASSLIGKEGDGWAGFTVGLMGALTVGIGPNLDRDGHVLDQLLDYCRTAQRDGRRISGDPD